MRFLRDYAMNRREILRSSLKSDYKYFDSCGTPEDIREWIESDDYRDKIKAIRESGEVNRNFKDR